MGRSAEAHLLLKGGRGEGKALQRFLLLKEMELGGGTEVMVGLVRAGAAVMVTVPESTALHPAGTGPGDRRISKEGERKFTLGINWAVKGLVEFGLCSKTGVGQEQCIILHWAGSFYSDLPPKSVDQKRDSTGGKRT